MRKFNLTALSVMLALGLTACQPPEAEKAAPAASGEAQTANEGGSVSIAVNDNACEPMELTVPSGQVVFNIKNNSGRKLEWEILKGVMVVDERENIAPGLSDKMTVTLLPGEYEMTCGLLTNPRGKLVVTDSGFKDTANEADLEKLSQPLADYKAYVQGEVKELVAKPKPLPKPSKQATLKRRNPCLPTPASITNASNRLPSFSANSTPSSMRVKTTSKTARKMPDLPAFTVSNTPFGWKKTCPA